MTGFYIKERTDGERVFVCKCCGHKNDVPICEYCGNGSKEKTTQEPTNDDAIKAARVLAKYCGRFEKCSQSCVFYRGLSCAVCCPFDYSFDDLQKGGKT